MNVTVLVPRAAVASVQIAAATMRANPHLEVGCLVDRVSGKLVSINGPSRR